MYSVVANIRQSLYAKCLGIAVMWQVAFTAMGVFIVSNFTKSSGVSFDYWLESPLRYMVNWDGFAYYHNLLGGYTDAMSQGAVFYPLFSVLVYALHFVTLGLIPVVVCGLIVNTIALSIIIWCFVKICKILVINYKWALLFFFTFVSAGFLNFFYTEAVFIAGSLLAYYFALSKQWFKMALVLGVLTSVRLPAILVIGLCGLEFMRAHDYKIKQILNKNLLVFLLAPTGFILFGLYLYIVRGDFFAMFNMYNVPWTQWPFHKFDPNIIGTLYSGVNDFYESVSLRTRSLSSALVAYILPFYALIILLVTSLYGIFKIKKWAIPLGVFGLVSFVFFTINSNVNSVHRYVFSSISVFLILSYIAMNTNKLGRASLLMFAAINAIIMVALFAGFVLLYFVG